MVESGAEVVDGVSEQESPMLGEGILEARNSHDDVTTLCVVFRPKSDWYLDVALTRHGSCLPCERIGIDYRPSPFEPRALEGVSHAR